MCVRVNVNVCLYMCVYVCVYVRTFVHTHMDTLYVCVCEYVCVCLYVCSVLKEPGVESINKECVSVRTALCRVSQCHGPARGGTTHNALC